MDTCLGRRETRERKHRDTKGGSHRLRLRRTTANGRSWQWNWRERDAQLEYRQCWKPTILHLATRVEISKPIMRLLVVLRLWEEGSVRFRQRHSWVMSNRFQQAEWFVQEMLIKAFRTIARLLKRSWARLVLKMGIRAMPKSQLGILEAIREAKHSS